MKKILVLAPHEDRAGRAASLAADLAERAGARVTLLRVLEEKQTPGLDVDRNEVQLKIRQLLVEVETQQVEEIGARLRSDGLEVSVEVCWGVAWEAVLERVRRDGYDLVVKPASGLQRRGHVFFGSTALNLFRRCPCPVWVVGDDGRLPRRLLAAIDPSGAVPRQRIASNLLDWADHVSRLCGADVHVGTSWRAVGEEVLRDRLEDDEWKAYLEEAHRTASTDLERALQSRSTPIPDERVHLAHGVPHESLPALAASQEIDLIVMGTLAREGRVGDELGETAEMVIRAARSSVLTIPPGVRPDAD